MTKLKNLQPIAPTTPPAAYIGGKRLLAKRLCEEINQIPHASYVEPFCGMGGVFFRRASRPKSEVINDLSRDVSNFFRVVKKHREALLLELSYQLTCRDDFDRLNQMNTDTLTDIERAARFFYLQKCTFGGNVKNRSFGVNRGGRPGSFSAHSTIKIIDAIHVRLHRVVIESLPYQEVLKRYDHPATLFYLDPPYWGCENDYGKNLFSRSDFTRLADCLTQIKGRFILSINDVREIRGIFESFRIQEVQTTYTLSKGRPTQANELIISN